jgi:hypothetical protein
METFVCLLIDGDGAIIASATIAARASADAEAQGVVLLQQNRHAVELELWRHGDKVRTVIREGDQNAVS